MFAEQNSLHEMPAAATTTFTTTTITTTTTTITTTTADDTTHLSVSGVSNKLVESVSNLLYGTADTVSSARLTQ